MPRLLFAVAAAVSAALPFADCVRASTNVASHVDWPLIKEPVYQSTPKYSLMIFGDAASGAKVWMVEDGNRLYIDKNGNGDLTDDGPPIEPNDTRHLDATSWDYHYSLDAITPTNGSRHTDFRLSCWNYNEKEDEYGLSVSVDGKIPMYAGWFGTFWSPNRETAPVIHFGGSFKPTLLRRGNFIIGEKHERLSIGFFNSSFGKGSESRLSIDALPRFVTPELIIEWPTAPGSAPVKTSHLLTERCCYWEFYTTAFEAPSGIVPGKAKVSVHLPVGVMPIELATTEIAELVVAPPFEPVK